MIQNAAELETPSTIVSPGTQNQERLTMYHRLG